jgi:intein/homing endonuclease
MDDDVYKQISDVEVGETVKSYLISGSPQNESDLNSLTWNYDGNQFPAGSYITNSNVVFKDVRQLEYGAMMEIVVDNDSLFSGINKKYLVFDTTSNKSSFKYTSELNAVTDLLYDLDGNMIQIDEVNFYVSDETNLNFVEIDVEDSDTYIINGSTAFNSVVSHNSPCFVAGTKILMQDGEVKNIEDVKIGDLIKSFDFEKNQVRVSEVSGIQSKNVGKIVEYVFSDGGTLKATFDHPLYVVDKGWCSFNESMSNSNYSIGAKVNKIKIGDFVKLIDKNIDLVEINVIEELTKVFNLKDVKSDHNYFANNVLVHNRACFISGTKIQMSDGSEKNIEEIQIGDLVISYNIKSQSTEICEVIKLLKPTHDDLIKYKFDDGREIICTQDHPFYVNDFNLSSYNPQLTIDRYEFTEQISKIHVGDTVFLKNKLQTQIIEIEELDLGPTQTYIFEVSNNHNFFANGILTHNKSCFVAGSKVLMGDGIEKNIEEILVGDIVVSYNELESSVETRNVTEVYSPTHDDLIELLLSDGTKIVSTFDHPYYVNNMDLASYEPKWTNERYKLPTEVVKIEIGNQVHKHNGEKLEIISINELERVQTQTYIISVEGNRNFYLNGILVHNK